MPPKIAACDDSMTPACGPWLTITRIIIHLQHGWRFQLGGRGHYFGEYVL